MVAGEYEGGTKCATLANLLGDSFQIHKTRANGPLSKYGRSLPNWPDT